MLRVLVTVGAYSADCHLFLFSFCPGLQRIALVVQITVHFLKPLLKGVVGQKTKFDFVAHVLRTKPLIVEKWFAPKLSV